MAYGYTTGYTRISSSGVTGTGTASDPKKLVTVVGLGSTGLTLTQTDTYVGGDESYRSTETLTNSTSTPVSAIIYRTADCYLQTSDASYGFHDSAGGGTYCSLSADNSPANRIEGFAPVEAGSHYFQGYYLSAFEYITNGLEYPDSCACATYQDTGVGIDWAVSVPGNGSITRTIVAGFSPDGTAVPPQATPTATTPASPANNNSPLVSGTAESDATVKLYTNSTCTSTVAGTGTGADFSSPGIEVHVDDNTTTDFYATATSASSGLTSICSPTYVTYAEVTPPAPDAPTGLTTDPVSPGNTLSPKVKGDAAAGTTVTVYTDSACTGDVAATGTAADFASPGLTATVTDGTTEFYATATNADGTSACSTAHATYTADATPPDKPTNLSTLPASPSNNDSPQVTVDAEPGSTVDVYSDDCTTLYGSATADGDGHATISGSGLQDGETTFHATATDALGNTSDCSDDSVTYELDTDPPSTPANLSTVPGSPGNTTNPHVKGEADDGSTITLYEGDDCTGDYLGTGSAADFEGSGIMVVVDADVTTDITARASDSAGNISDCSAVLAYQEDGTAPAAPTALSVSPASPANDNDPVVSGQVDADVATVQLYTDEFCNETVGGPGDASDFVSPGLDAPVADDSETTFYATATDAAGNVSDCSTASVEYLEDSTKPLTTDDVPAGYVNHAVEVTLDATDDNGSGVDATYYTTGTNPADPDTSSDTYSTTTKPVLANGERIKYFSVDKAGNKEDVETSRAAKVDTAAPASQADAPALTRSTAIDVAWSAADTGGAGLASVDLYVKKPGASTYAKVATDSSPGSDGHFAYAADGGEGSYAFYTVAHDAVSNDEAAPSAADAVTRLDQTAPAIALTSPADGAVTQDSTPTFAGTAGIAPGDSSAVKVTVSSASGDVVATLDATADASGNWSVDAGSPLANGDYSARATQVDDAGNSADSSAHKFTVAVPGVVPPGDTPSDTNAPPGRASVERPDADRPHPDQRLGAGDADPHPLPRQRRLDAVQGHADPSGDGLQHAREQREGDGEEGVVLGSCRDDQGGPHPGTGHHARAAREEAPRGRAGHRDVHGRQAAEATRVAVQPLSSRTRAVRAASLA